MGWKRYRSCTISKRIKRSVIFYYSIKEEYQKNKELISDQYEIKNSLVQAVNKTKSKGSSTCVVLFFNSETKKVCATYVGDSLYMILRYNESKRLFEIYHKSSEQQHKFNQPFQVGTNGDSPFSAITETHDIKDKDIFIVASDGLWDNMFDEMITWAVNKEIIDGYLKDCNLVAENLANTAEKFSLDAFYESPFAIRAKQKGFEYIGGKQDDITIVVTQILKINDSELISLNERVEGKAI